MHDPNIVPSRTTSLVTLGKWLYFNYLVLWIRRKPGFLECLCQGKQKIPHRECVAGCGLHFFNIDKVITGPKWCVIKRLLYRANAEEDRKMQPSPRRNNFSFPASVHFEMIPYIDLNQVTHLCHCMSICSEPSSRMKTNETLDDSRCLAKGNSGLFSILSQFRCVSLFTHQVMPSSGSDTHYLVMHNLLYCKHA
jgi:hypothetical protein